MMALVSTNNYIVLLLTINLLSEVAYTESDVAYVQNLNAECLRCMCNAATDCNRSVGCKGGYCGPFKISRVYWADCGKNVLPNDSPDRKGAFEDCAGDYQCATVTVINYMTKYGKDCNGDGVTDCDDYTMIHFNGGFQCSPPLTRSEAGRNYTNRYQLCAPLRNTII